MTALIDLPAQAPARGDGNFTAAGEMGGAGHVADGRRHFVEIVVPVYNEEEVLESSIRRLADYLGAHFPFRWVVTIADNASNDRTWQIAQRLAGGLAGVEALHLDEKGRGRALRAAWLTSQAEVVAYTDVDLSTDLNALLPLVAPLISGHSDVAIGSRLANGAQVVRGPKREVISRCYNGLLRNVAGARFRDAQCGFKAIRRDAAVVLLDAVENDNWFFDTELLLLAENSGMRIHEVPVDWTDDPDTRVHILATALEDLRGVWSVKRRAWRGRLGVTWPSRTRRTSATDRSRPPADEGGGPPASGDLARRLLSFATVGVISTLLYLVAFVMLRPFMGAPAANALCLTGTTVINTSLNRRFTFGITDRVNLVRHHLQAGIAFVAALLITSGALALFATRVPDATRIQELTVALGANAFATFFRFAILNAWVFRAGRRAGKTETGEVTP